MFHSHKTGVICCYKECSVVNEEDAKDANKQKINKNRKRKEKQPTRDRTNKQEMQSSIEVNMVSLIQ
jgi:hypothetical protein